MRALAYLRVDDSTPPLEQQEDAVQAFCHQGNHQLQRTFTDVASDSDDHRPEFQRIVDHIRTSGQGFLVVVPGPECLGSTLEKAVERILELDALDVKLACASEDLPDPLQAATARWGLSRGQRIRDAMRSKAVRGEGLGKPPYGYCIGVEGKLEVVPEEARVVQLIYRLYTQEDLGIRRIARHLNQRGHSTRRGGPWSMVTLRDILRNRVYLGTYSRFGMRIPRSHPPLVEREVFQQVQERMRSRSPAPRRVEVAREPFLLSGLLYCAACGNRMMGVTRRQSWTRKDNTRVTGNYRYYQCQSRTNRSICQYHTWRAVELEGRVRNELVAYLGQPAATALPSLHHQDTPPQSQTAVKALERRFLQSVRSAAEGALSMARLREALKEIQQQRAYLVKGEVAEEAEREPEGSLLRRLTEDWEDTPFPTRQRLLRGLIARVDVFDDGPRLTLRQ